MVTHNSKSDLSLVDINLPMLVAGRFMKALMVTIGMTSPMTGCFDSVLSDSLLFQHAGYDHFCRNRSYSAIRISVSGS